MTLEQIIGLDWSAEELEKLSDKELIEKLLPCFNVTRPDMATRPSNGIRKMETPQMSFKMQERLKIAAQAGIDIGFIAKFKGKKR